MVLKNQEDAKSGTRLCITENVQLSELIPVPVRSLQLSIEESASTRL